MSAMEKTADDAWGALDDVWHRVFEEAWLSWGTGNFGVGAALVVPEGRDAGIVAVGRNLVATPSPAEQPLAGNYMAHAEMNAFAALDSYSARGMHLYSTLEPCLMCGATAIFLNVDAIHFAARDEYYQSFNEGLWPHHPYTRDRQPTSTQALFGRLSGFARLLPLSHTMLTTPDSAPAEAARKQRPRLADLAGSPACDRLRRLAATGGTVLEGLRLVWPDLADPAPTSGLRG